MSKTRTYLWLTQEVKDALAKQAAAEVVSGELPRLHGAESALAERLLRRGLGLPDQRKGGSGNESA